MGLRAALKSALAQYVSFDGRASRSEFWWFTLFYYGLFFAAGILSKALSGIGSSLVATFGAVVLFSLFLPSVSVRVRRLHDAGYSGWYLLVALLPFLGGLILLGLSLQDGIPGPNPYGPDPKSRPAIDYRSRIDY
ncbi:DUF805 domain-containing protein [Nocardia acidivorans]|uniref:DUF805 domain-containing protein n=1 Tax=Nocardia acidivorans TaxID=404580 RepID=UPI0008329711|nr:DUF805 domain-containing protein [Nocardia acidivorans]